jgi:hypothetical protein
MFLVQMIRCLKSSLFVRLEFICKVLLSNHDVFIRMLLWRICMWTWVRWNQLILAFLKICIWVFVNLIWYCIALEEKLHLQLRSIGKPERWPVDHFFVYYSLMRGDTFYLCHRDICISRIELVLFWVLHYFPSLTISWGSLYVYSLLIPHIYKE